MKALRSRYLLLLIVALLLPAHASAAEPLPRETLHGELKQPGYRSRKVIAFLGDGFAEKDMEAYRAACRELTDYLVKRDSFDQFEHRFTVVRVDAVSAKSGIWREIDKDKDPEFRSRFGMYIPVKDGSEDYPAIRDLDGKPFNLESELRKAVGDLYPDVTVLLLNSEAYGAWARGSYTVLTKDKTYKETLAHELGHAMGDLSDEYTGANARSGEHPLPSEEPKRRNVTLESKPEKAKWAYWVEKDNGVGCYEGAAVRNTGIYRPEKECAMSSNTPPFCRVCRESLALKFQESRSLIVGTAPPRDDQWSTARLDLGTGPGPARFVVRVNAGKKSELVGEWQVNFQGGASNPGDPKKDIDIDKQLIPEINALLTERANRTKGTIDKRDGYWLFNFTVDTSSLPNGEHTVKFRVRDESPAFHPKHRPIAEEREFKLTTRNYTLGADFGNILRHLKPAGP